MSYTGGYTQTMPGAVLIDTGAMDRILDINEIDMRVTVEAGCSWAKLYDTLKPLGLRTPFWGTLSGLKATVGGGMSQNCLFWGSARHGSGPQSCLAMEVVLADGTILKTGEGVARPYGPDMTGLFLGDTGAMGVKATITLRLIARRRRTAMPVLPSTPMALPSPPWRRSSVQGWRPKSLASTPTSTPFA
ncbi:MAG: FAD-binding oxidoreductase [Sphingopyxis sp.]|nr:FAD-binding oxidoreductase [Sphingopyxis sp.]